MAALTKALDRGRTLVEGALDWVHLGGGAASGSAVIQEIPVSVVKAIDLARKAPFAIAAAAITDGQSFTMFIYSNGARPQPPDWQAILQAGKDGHTARCRF